MKKLAYHLFNIAFIHLTLMIPRQVYAQEVPKNLEEFSQEQIDTVKNLINMVTEFFVKYSFQVLGGIIVLVLGFILAGFVARFILKLLQKKNVDVTISKFVVGIVKLLILAFAVIVALGKFGIEIAPLIAGISVIGFGTSFALQGALSNYVAGFTLILTRPFRVGDIIEVAEVMGEVSDIKLPRTELKTVDGIKVLVPNNKIIGEIIHNFSTYKRIDITVGVSYKADIQKAIDVVEGVLKNDQGVYQGKVPKVGVTEFADSSVNIYARLWCKQDDYWDTKFNVNKNIFAEFEKHNIEIPFPQRDVHIFQDT